MFLSIRKRSVKMDFKEDLSSQIPALRLLMNMGYTYLTPEEALELRGGSTSKVVLEPILKQQLQKINRISFKRNDYAFSEGNIQKAINDLTELRADGLIRDNEAVYDLLTLGKSLEQTIDGYVKSFSLKYIDWETPENNVFHVTDEFSVSRVRSNQTRRPDVVVFVNGIPLAVIECKRPDIKHPLDEAVSQQLRNQREESEIPYLFTYSQILLAVCQNDAKYATCGTPKKFWSIWKEDLRYSNEQYFKEQLDRLVNQPLKLEQIEQLKASRKKELHDSIDELSTMERMASLQDKAVYALLSIHRLLEICYRYIVFDNQVKKITRYQQYFAVEQTLRQITAVDGDQPRPGGVIWHTTGSGKSLTMVMLAKSIAINKKIINPKVILVTDRVDLDDQIYHTFKACGVQVERAKTGEHLAELVTKGSASVITSIIDKFETACNKKVRDESCNIFVLVDESHRTQYGTSHAKMKNVFPNACYIGFTGTPLTKKDKSTLKKFGGIIHDYSMDAAVKDKAVAPLLYEGRMSELHGDQKAIDRWFERMSKGMTEKQKVDLKMKLKREEVFTKSDERMSEIAYDISRHFADFYKGTGFKGQFACSGKPSALKYKKLFDEFGLVSTEIIISAPDSRKGNKNTADEDTPEVQVFWNKMMKRFGNEKSYVKQLTQAFKSGDEPDILIVVDKLLTGFDAPRNAVLYVDKKLQEHNLLQAIARVNRLYDGKDYGLIVDYRGIFGELNKAREIYSTLEGFDKDDLEGTCIDVTEVIATLPESHTNLWQIFKGVKNRSDHEEMQAYLAFEDRRDEFYECLNRFAKTLRAAFASSQFWTDVDEDLVNRYKQDLKMFLNLRSAVKQRYSETIVFAEYESQIELMVQKCIGADAVKTIVEQVSVFEIEDFDRELEKLESDAAKAETIASRTKKTCHENMAENPALYKKLSELIDQAISDYRAKRIAESEYLKRVKECMKQARGQGDGSNIPEVLKGYKDAVAYYGEIHDKIEPYGIDLSCDLKEIAAQTAIKAEEIIKQHKIRDWQNNLDVQNSILNDLEDYLFSIKGRHDIDLSMDDIDQLLDDILMIAKNRDKLRD